MCGAGRKGLDVAERILMEGQAGCSGHVEARDLTEYKVSLIEENIERMGLCNVTAVCQDASVYDENQRVKRILDRRSALFRSGSAWEENRSEI